MEIENKSLVIALNGINQEVRQATRKEVGEWMEKAPGCEGSLYLLLMGTLKQGRLPTDDEMTIAKLRK